MSIRNILTTHNLLAVSANVREAAINTAATLDSSMLVGKEDIIEIDPKRENNADEAHGKEEPDTVYDLGGLSGIKMNFKRAQPQHFGFLLSYWAGVSTPAAAGALGYKHAIAPIGFDLDSARSNPSFTAAQRLGNQVAKELFYSLFVDDVTVEFNKDDWAKINGSCVGTGRKDDNVTEETIAALDNVTSLTLATNGVQGSDAATRLANVHQIIAEHPSGTWVDVTYSAVSDATPAVITITSVGGGGETINYKVLYIPTESASWMTFPARVEESPLRTVQLAVNIGGKWNGSAIAGGHTLGAELSSFKWNGKNNIKPEFAPGSGNLYYASRALRSGRTQTITLGREFRDYVFQNHITNNDTFVIYALAQGAEYEAGHNYEVGMVFPKCSVKKAPRGGSGGRLSEGIEIDVLEDSTYGSFYAWVKNKVQKYAAAS